MTDQTDSSARESLSAMMDNEALELELLRVTKKLSEDKGLRQAWHRYHLVSSLVHSERGRDTSVTMTDLSVQIASAIELEPELSIAPLADETASKSLSPPASSNRVFAKIALAASVAVIAVFGVQQLQIGVDSSGPGNEMINTVAGNQLDAEPGMSDAGPRGTGPHDIGPQFQLPSGYAAPHINIRTASTAPVYSINRAMPGQPLSYGAETLVDKHTDASLGADAVSKDNGANDIRDSETHRQIQNYLNYMMLRYAQ